MFLYALKSSIVLSLLYLPYLLTLRRESFFSFNRGVLCFVLLAALLLPLCNLPALSLDENPVVGAAQLQMIEVGIPVALGTVPDAAQQELPQTSWFAVVATLYIMVAAGMLFCRLRDAFRLHRIIRRDCLWQQEEHDVRIFCHAEDIPPFSWHHTIVIGRADYEKNGACIVRHEMGHVLSGHSWDILLLTIVQLLQWFNPLVWLMGQSLQDVHEYEADDYVLRGGISLEEYRYLLIQKAVGASPYVFANNFNHSLLKKRIKMMCQKKSNPWHRAKALYVIPVALLALSAFATTESKEVRNIAQNTTAPVLDDDNKIYDTVEEIAQFPGDINDLYEFLGQNIRYPAKARDLGQQGRVIVQFVVEKDGSISDVKAHESVTKVTAPTVPNAVNGKPLTPEEQTAQREAIAAARQELVEEGIRVVKSMPNWTPAKEKGKLVRMRFVLPIQFKLPETMKLPEANK